MNRLRLLCLLAIASTIAVPSTVSAVSPTDSSTAAANQSAFYEQIADLFGQHRGKAAAAVVNLKTGEAYAWDGDRVMPTASLIKLPVMIEAYRQVDAGDLSLEKMLTLEEQDKTPGSGVLTEHFSAGAKLSVRDAIQLMIAYSDNTATNLVVDQIGLPATAALMKELGYPETQLHSKVWLRETSIAKDRSVKYGLGSTTANDMVGLLSKLQANEVATDESCEAMLVHLRACQDKSKVRRYLPDSVTVANKTGAVSASRTDAGLIESTAGTIAYCLLTTDNDDGSWTDENEAELLAGEFGRAVYAHFVGDTDTPAAPAARVLSIGDDGSLVEALQRTLNARTKPSVAIGADGDFGPNTEKAVRTFQTQAGLEPTGKVDVATWRALGPLVEEDAETTDTAEPEPLTPPVAADSLDGPPIVSCKAYAIADADTGKLLWGYNDSQARDPASTTKIMTAYVVLSLSQEDPSILDEVMVFSERADETSGSTSGVRAGEQLTVRQCLYGLMLPSGNDASVALAEHFGERVAPAGATDQSEEGEKADAYDQFVAAMNAAADRIGMDESHFENTHGLTAEGHQLSARDLVTLVRKSREIPLFREITKTRRKSATLDSLTGYQRKVVWNNTNRLLRIEGFDGVKTGTTGKAGACLASVGARDGKRLVVVVLGSACSEARYVDSRNLYRWAWRQLLEEEGSNDAP